MEIKPAPHDDSLVLYDDSLVEMNSDLLGVVCEYLPNSMIFALAYTSRRLHERLFNEERLIKKVKLGEKLKEEMRKEIQESIKKRVLIFSRKLVFWSNLGNINSFLPKNRTVMNILEEVFGEEGSLEGVTNVVASNKKLSSFPKLNSNHLVTLSLDKNNLITITFLGKNVYISCYDNPSLQEIIIHKSSNIRVIPKSVSKRFIPDPNQQARRLEM